VFAAGHFNAALVVLRLSRAFGIDTLGSALPAFLRRCPIGSMTPLIFLALVVLIWLPVSRPFADGDSINRLLPQRRHFVDLFRLHPYAHSCVWYWRGRPMSG
jgi:hypothetical protein